MTRLFYRRVRDHQLRHVCRSASPSVHMDKSVLNALIFIKYNIWVFFGTLSRSLKFRFNPTRVTDALHVDFCTFTITSLWIPLRKRHVSPRLWKSENTFFTLFLPCIVLTSNYSNQQMYIKLLKAIHDVQNNSDMFRRQGTNFSEFKISCNYQNKNLSTVL